MPFEFFLVVLVVMAQLMALTAVLVAAAVSTYFNPQSRADRAKDAQLAELVQASHDVYPDFYARAEAKPARNLPPMLVAAAAAGRRVYWILREAMAYRGRHRFNRKEPFYTRQGTFAGIDELLSGKQSAVSA